jgi:hypothetical protein
LSSADEATDRATVSATGISIARCRELLGEQAESMTDQEIAGLRLHAETMASILVEMYGEHRRTTE